MPAIAKPGWAALAVALLCVLVRPAPAGAAGLQLPPAARQGIDLLYKGQPEQAIEKFHQVETAAPDHPMGYVMEADALWWQIYCQACEIKWNMVDAWQRPRLPADGAYLALVDKARTLAEAHIAQGDSAEMELYAGLALLLRARLLGLIDDRRGTARAGVEARARMLRCLELDPEMADAYTGLGLYNYYVNALSAFAKILRFFMGIPGGDKREGVRQLRVAMQQGVLTAVEARFYLAKNLRTYDHDYAASIEVMTPLAAEFPQNPSFRLLLGDTQAKLAHSDLAAAEFRAAAQLQVSDAACAARVRVLVQQEMAALVPAAKSPAP